ncbi:MAG: hypothetical protein IJE68_04320 [Clostridia bacterium]|nr:hypothetical protein [Clostridia bacterium]
MNYQSYDEYMRSLMGYPNMRTSMNQNMNTGMNMEMNMGMNPFMNINMDTSSEDLERMYPESYKVVYPMVCSACDNIRTPVTEEMIDMMTDDIYDRAEADGRINIDISVEVRDSESSSESSQENRQRRPRRRNRFFRDLIRVLLLRELLRRRRRFPIRPF